jgi:hypothetical protein
MSISSGAQKIMIKMECKETYPALTVKTTREIIEVPGKNLEEENQAVKSNMADELKEMGLTAKAISRLLNISGHRR